MPKPLTPVQTKKWGTGILTELSQLVTKRVSAQRCPEQPLRGTQPPIHQHSLSFGLLTDIAPAGQALPTQHHPRSRWSHLSWILLLTKLPLPTFEGGEETESIERKGKHLGRGSLCPASLTPSREVTNHPAAGFVLLSAQERLRGRTSVVKEKGNAIPYSERNPISFPPLMKACAVQVSSVLTHLKDARDAHQSGGGDPWEMEGRRAGAMGQNLKKELEGA